MCGTGFGLTSGSPYFMGTPGIRDADIISASHTAKSFPLI